MKQQKSVLIVRNATPSDYEVIAAFRISEFQTAREFDLVDTKPLSLFSNDVYIVEQDGIIISTVQVECSYDIENFNRICAVQIPNNFEGFGTFYLSRAATSKAYRNTGLNSLLRLIILQNAINKKDINSLTGFAYENAPRLRLLQSIGYNLIETKLLNHYYTVPKGKLFFLELNKNRFSTAYEYLSLEVKRLRQNFDFFIQDSNV